VARLRFESAAAIQLACDRFEYDSGAGEITRGCASKSSLQRGLDRSGHVSVECLSVAGQSQQPSPPIAFIWAAPDQTTTLESLQ
jgi:hypothetical protein